MARIRSIKPEFFVDEDLQDLEAEHPGAYCMMVYAGLWGHCSKDGVFEYKPRVLKLSILPFLPFAMAETLALLEESGFIRRFCVEGKEYGFIPSFEKHQRISGKEAQFSPKYPGPPDCGPAENQEEKEGSTGEAPGKNQGSDREAQEREKEREKEEDLNQSFVGGEVVDTARACESPPPKSEEREERIEAEVGRIKGLHLQTCGLNTLPPLAIIRDILQSGKPASLIDDVYQAHGGDIPKWRQRNIVERLKALRDGVERSPPAGKRTGMSPSERRQQETFEACRAFVGGGSD